MYDSIVDIYNIIGGLPVYRYSIDEKIEQKTIDDIHIRKKTLQNHLFPNVYTPIINRKFRLGDKIQHNFYGTGVITEICPVLLDFEFVVTFEHCSRAVMMYSCTKI